ncbi:MAG: hypothetical protein Q9214_001145 [Letrouitia sp. 1 TL-2023]
MTPPSKYEPQSSSTLIPLSERNSTAPVKLRRKDLQKTVIQVNVGHTDSAETFTIHKELVCHYSPFFRAALAGPWTEAETGIVNLPSDIPNVFEAFQAWLYAQTLELDETQESDATFLMKLQVFGERMVVPDFQNAAMDALRLVKLNSKPPALFKPSEIEYAYENTSAGSPLRKLITDFYVWEANMLIFIDNFALDSYPMAFVVDVTKGYVTQFPRPKKSSTKPYVAVPELYHVPSQLTS